MRSGHSIGQDIHNLDLTHGATPLLGGCPFQDTGDAGAPSGTSKEKWSANNSLAFYHQPSLYTYWRTDASCKRDGQRHLYPTTCRISSER